MAINETKLKDLAAQVARYADAHRATGKSRRIIVPAHVRAPSLLSDNEREVKLRRIRWLCQRYGLQWLLDQRTRGVELEDLPDERLVEVAAVFEKALRCYMEGVSFDDAGLVEWAE